MCILLGWLFHPLVFTELLDEHNLVYLIDFSCVSEVVPSTLLDPFISVVVLLSLPVKTNLRVVMSSLVQTHANKSFTFSTDFWCSLIALWWSKRFRVWLMGFVWYIWRVFDMFGLFVLKSYQVFLKLMCQALCFRDSIKQWMKYTGNILPSNKAAHLPSFACQYLPKVLCVSSFFYLSAPRNKGTCRTISDRRNCFLSIREIVKNKGKSYQRKTLNYWLR